MLRRTLLAGVALATIGVAGPARAAEEVEVIHWWTSGGEAAALQVLRENLEKQGITWKDAAIAGGGGDQARTVLQARMAAGNPDRKSTRLNSSHANISYAVFCLKKKKNR